MTGTASAQAWGTAARGSPSAAPVEQAELAESVEQAEQAELVEQAEQAESAERAVPVGSAEDAELAERVGDAVNALPDVTGLSALVATYRVGTPVTGVAVRDDVVEIAVVVRFGRPLEEVADEVRAAARPLAGSRRVDVLIADIVTG